MRFQSAKPFSILALACALPLLPGCASEPLVVYRDKVSETPVPVFTKLPPSLTADCIPLFDYPPGTDLTVREATQRLIAVEDALAMCRLQLERIRQMEDRHVKANTDQ